MSLLPDMTDPRYLDEVGWFLYHEQYGRQQFGGSYTEERLAYSHLLRAEVLEACGQDARWLHEKTVVSIGGGCTGDLTTWDAAVKIAIDPLLAVYQQLGMLLNDLAGTNPTLYLSVGIEALPLLDGCADLVICRNALDHMPEPQIALQQINRILKTDALLFLSVDIGGVATPDEPTVFSEDSLKSLVETHFSIVWQRTMSLSHSGWRPGSVRILARKKQPSPPQLDRDRILQAYMARIAQNA